MLEGHPEMTAFFPRTLSDHDTVSLFWWVPSILGYPPNACFYESREATLGGPVEDAVSIRPWEFIRDGRTVSVVLLQLANLMGCNPIYLPAAETLSFELKQNFLRTQTVPCQPGLCETIVYQRAGG